MLLSRGTAVAPARARLPTCDLHHGILGVAPLRCLWSPILSILAASLRVFLAVRSELDFDAECAESFSECSHLLFQCFGR